MTEIEKSRIHLLDVIRGVAIVAIMLLHNMEHFDVYYLPEYLPGWLKQLDAIVWDVLFFIFASKSYAMFALMFGVTFAIQLHNSAKRDKPFRARFAWRMLLLFGFGMLNSMFFQGDILTIYAVIGLLLIPLTKFSDKTILGIAVFLMLLPYEWWKLAYAVQHPTEAINNPVSWTYFGKMMEYIPNPSFWDTAIGNLTNGKIAVLLWNWENGRFFTILALFLFGYILGKRKLFATSNSNKMFWKKALRYAIIAFIPLFILQKNLNVLIESDIIRRPVSTMETAWTNFAFMIILVAGLTLLFQQKWGQKKLMYFASFGKMSLSNYIMQSMLGAAIYYGWGLGLYKYTGATFGVLIGLVLTFLMGKFCVYWTQKYKRGPFETIWHKFTWIGTNKK